MKYSFEEIKIIEEIENELIAAVRYGDLREGNMENCLNNIFKKYKKYE